jgi:hypothetical protein
MALLRSIGALAFVLGVALMALDAARSLKIGRFETTSLERFWTNLGGDGVWALRTHLSEWLGATADPVLGLPAAFVAFGLGLAILLVCDAAARPSSRPPLAS